MFMSGILYTNSYVTYPVVYRRPWSRNLSAVHAKLERRRHRRPLETLGDEGSPHINRMRDVLIQRAHDSSRSQLQELRQRAGRLYRIEQEIARRQLDRAPLDTRWT
ncbi:hypothetical protein RRG08_046564 [Elysia crispata]|uniref:Uncharacterized protein n=1 Tax=Elysia crispata TaxID=231223 RepID=A0AAE1APL1_9GAST|nr:hypothetical protein RRG08_046564 [Elysia crispata]